MGSAGANETRVDASAQPEPSSTAEQPEPSSTSEQPEPSSTADLPRFACVAASPHFDLEHMQPFRLTDDLAEVVESTLESMSPAQQARQMLGVEGPPRDFQDAMRSPDVEVPGLGTIRGFRYRDGNRGVNLEEGQDNRPSDGRAFATVFPSASLRAASWDLSLERRIGEAIGDETAASLNNVLLAPCMNVVRHPHWGRTQDTYGEDSYSIGRMASAFTVGAQRYVLACARHFAANNVEKERARQDAVLNEQTLREVYGRHFEMVVQDGGVACIMAANNMVNGVKATQNAQLLRGVLKAPVAQGGMGFEGFVLTDWWAMPGEYSVPDAATAQAVAHEALLAGTDVELPWDLHYNASTLASADPSLVEEAARRLLTQKFRFQTAWDTDAWSLEPPTSTLTEGSITANAAHEALAEEAALRSAVLLTNGLDAGAQVLPLRAGSVAVIGAKAEVRLISESLPKSCPVDDCPACSGVVDNRRCTFDFATDPALGDRGSGRVNADPERTVGPFAGIAQIAGPGTAVTSGSTVEAAATADAVVVVVGYTASDEGEEYPIAMGGDRSSLDLPHGQNELVLGVLDLGKPTVIVVEAGSIVNLPWLAHANLQQATIWAGYPGQRGGLALGKLIFGEANFGGKMPMAWPAEAELPVFRQTDLVTNMGYFFGYREFDRRRYVEGASVELRFPFGHGMSYSSFEYSNLSLPCTSAAPSAVIDVSIDIENTSAIDGDEVAMLFVKPPPPPATVTGERPWKELKSFARVSVPAGRKVTALLPLRVADLRRWEGGADGRWLIDPGDYTILVGKDAADAETTRNTATLTISGE